MSFNEILVRFTFILMTCTSLGFAERSESASALQIVLSIHGGLKEPVLVLLDLGEIYLDNNNFKRAAEILSQATRVEPGSVVAHYALWRARYKLSEYAEAEQAFTRAALLDKDFEAAELMLLHVYVRQGKLSEALSRMDALLRKNHGNSLNPALEKFRSEVVVALANLKQGAEKQK